MNLVAGARIGPYTILSPLGAGGMGEVYRGKDTRLDRVVAIKILPREVAANPSRRRRFEHEARAISRLSHSHICALYDVGEDGDLPFLVMEHLEGETLADRLAHGPLPIRDAIGMAIQIADALEHAHRQRIIHRDLKPANIMLTRSGVKLLDFGVAKLWAVEDHDHRTAEGSHLAETETQEGVIVGTVNYMAPEQLDGRDVDARADLFAFGAVLYEMVTGKQAFEGSGFASVAVKILKEEVPVPSSARRQNATAGTDPSITRESIPPLLDHIIGRCLAKNPDDRWQTASDLKQALKWIGEGSTTSSPLLPAAMTTRRPYLPWAAAAVAVVVATVAVLAWIGQSRSPEARDNSAVQFQVYPPDDANFGMSPAVMAVSPDGRSLAFHATSREGVSAIWVRTLDSLLARRVPGTDRAVQPFWSPDSRSLAFFVEGKLKKVAVSGGLAQTIADEGTSQSGSWSKDNVLLFKLGGQGNLFKIPSSGGVATPATTLDASRGETAHTWPHFLPDGRHFLFHSQSRQPEYDGVLHVGSLDSTTTTPLGRTDSHAVYALGYLLYLRANTLVAHPFDAGGIRFVGEPVGIADKVDYNNITRRGAFSVSDTGTLVYRPLGDTQLAWFDRNGRDLGSIGPLARYGNPALSPNETRLAVDRIDPETGTADIWVIDLERGSPSRLTHDPGQDQKPLWSRDGSRIVFASNRGGGGFYQTSASGAGEDQLLLPAVGRDPDGGSPLGGAASPLGWAADGGFLVYVASKRIADREIVALWQFPMSGGVTPPPLLQTQAGVYDGQLSPNGRWIAYVSRESGNSEVWVRQALSGENGVQISVNGGIEPKWRGDGKELVYLGRDQSLMSVAVSTEPRLTAGPPSRLFTTRMLGFMATNTRNQYVITADGQRVLINQPPDGASGSPLTVVVNWKTALQP